MAAGYIPRNRGSVLRSHLTKVCPRPRLAAHLAAIRSESASSAQKMNLREPGMYFGRPNARCGQVGGPGVRAGSQVPAYARAPESASSHGQGKARSRDLGVQVPTGWDSQAGSYGVIGHPPATRISRVCRLAIMAWPAPAPTP